MPNNTTAYCYGTALKNVRPIKTNLPNEKSKPSVWSSPLDGGYLLLFFRCFSMETINVYRLIYFKNI